MNIEMLDTIALVAITIVVTLLLCKATGLFNGKTGATGAQGVAGEPGKPGTQEDLKSALAIFLGKVKQHEPTCKCEMPPVVRDGDTVVLKGKDGRFDAVQILKVAIGPTSPTGDRGLEGSKAYRGQENPTDNQQKQDPLKS